MEPVTLNELARLNPAGYGAVKGWIQVVDALNNSASKRNNSSYYYNSGGSRSVANEDTKVFNHQALIESIDQSALNEAHKWYAYLAWLDPGTEAYTLEDYVKFCESLPPGSWGYPWHKSYGGHENWVGHLVAHQNSFTQWPLAGIASIVNDQIKKPKVPLGYWVAMLNEYLEDASYEDTFAAYLEEADEQIKNKARTFHMRRLTHTESLIRWASQNTVASLRPFTTIKQRNLVLSQPKAVWAILPQEAVAFTGGKSMEITEKFLAGLQKKVAPDAKRERAVTADDLMAEGLLLWAQGLVTSTHRMPKGSYLLTLNQKLSDGMSTFRSEGDMDLTMALLEKAREANLDAFGAFGLLAGLINPRGFMRGNTDSSRILLDELLTADVASLHLVAEVILGHTSEPFSLKEWREILQDSVMLRSPLGMIEPLFVTGVRKKPQAVPTLVQEIRVCFKRGQ